MQRSNDDFRTDLNSNPKRTDREIFTDERTDQKVHKHLEDEDDVITDADLENIKTEMTPATEAEEIEAARKEGFSEEEISAIDDEN